MSTRLKGVLSTLMKYFSPLIELVKTPGRKKVISKKPQPTSKMTQVVSASSEVRFVTALMKMSRE